MGREIILYTAEMCIDCQKLKALMDAEGLSYETRDIQQEHGHRAELEARTGKVGVPYLVMDGEWVRGYVAGQGYDEAYARRVLGLEIG
jgi:glutaredoxin